MVLRHSAEQMAKAAALNYLFILLALLGFPINEMTLLLGDLTVSKPNSRTHEVLKFFLKCIYKCVAWQCIGCMYVGGFRCVWSGVSGWMDGWIDGARVTFHFNDTPTRPHKFSQLEADEVGVLLCARAGYDPAAAIRVRMYA